MKKDTSLTIIICTSNRQAILNKTLGSIYNYSLKHLDIEFLVINNNTNKDLSNSINNICQKYKNFSCIDFPKPGLSKARNKGISLTKSPWIIFLDDDVQIDESFLTKAKEIMDSNQFDCFGGMYYPWYPEGKPKWLADDFGKKEALRSDTGLIHLPEDGFLSGGILAVKKEALDTIGGFRTDLGMTDGIGYGEEDDLQLRLQAAGYRIGFVPDWYMHHAVLSHKHKVSWHLKSAYAHGRDAQRIHQTYSKSSILLKLTQVIMTAFVKRGPVALYKCFFEKKFYWQNAILYILEPIYGWLGKLKGVDFKSSSLSNSSNISA